MLSQTGCVWDQVDTQGRQSGYGMRIRIRQACSVLLSAFLLSCSDPIPVPPGKAEYVGLWVASDRYISIFVTGRLEYREKLSLGMHNRVASNFTFEGNTIDTGMLASFVIDEPPYEEKGQWKMQMEGVLYLRTGSPVLYGRSNNWPEGVH